MMMMTDLITNEHKMSGIDLLLLAYRIYWPLLVLLEMILNNFKGICAATPL